MSAPPKSDVPERPSQAPSNGKGFLEEAPGQRSMMRLMNVISLLAAVVFGFMILQAEDPTRLEFYVLVGFLLGAFAPKVFQKYAEQSLAVNFQGND